MCPRRDDERLLRSRHDCGALCARRACRACCGALHAHHHGDRAERVIGKAPPVQENQRVLAADAAQVRPDESSPVPGAYGKQIVESVEVGGDMRKDLAGGGPSSARDVLARDDLNRKRSLCVRAQDVRSSNLDLFAKRRRDDRKK